MSKEIADYIEKQINEVIETKVNEINKTKIAYEKLPEDLRKQYNFSDEIILELFKYAESRQAFHVNYIKALADYWNSENVKTVEDLKRLKIIK